MATYPFKAGFGKGEISLPAELFPIEGFKGIHDLPNARVMVMQSGAEMMAIVSLEMVNVPPRDIELCQEIVSQATGAPRERIWVHVTHAISTMHEPGPQAGPGQRERFDGAIRQAITDAATQAAAGFTEARLGWGVGTCDANINRDVETPFGWWTGLNPDGPSNKDMTILRVETLAGAPLGFLISYGIKPCALDNAGMAANDRLISSDVCGVCSRMMEQHFGVPALFCVSAAGDQVPRQQALLDEIDAAGAVIPKDLGVAAGLELVAKYGTIMGRDAISIADRIHCTETDAPIRHSVLSFPWPKHANRQKEGPKPAPAYVAAGEVCVTAEIFALGDAAFVAEKPEINCRTEQALKERSPFRHTLLLCMVNGGMKYMPDRTAYERNTFEAQRSMLMPGAAEHFVDTVAAELGRIAQKG